MDHKDVIEEEPGLLFVLTDPSAGQKPLAIRQLVNRYVQHYSHRKRRQVAARRLSTKGPIPFLRRASCPTSSEQQSTPSPDSQSDDHYALRKASTNISDGGLCSANVADSSALMSHHGAPLRTCQADNSSAFLDAQAANTAIGSSPRSLFSIAKLDPFASSVAPLTLSMNRAFHYCKY
jgi:hypothetical protein